MKKITITLCLLVFLLSLLIGCTDQNKSADSNNNNMVVSADLQEHFHSLNELNAKAEEVLEIKVTGNQETIVYGDIPFTISHAKVLSSLKGTVKVGDEINILETGGKYKPKSKDGKGFLPEVNYLFDGIPVMKDGEHLFVFLYKYDGPVAKNVYMPLGVYQGKFKVQDNGKVEQQAPKEEKIKENTFPDVDAFKVKVNIKK